MTAVEVRESDEGTLLRYSGDVPRKGDSVRLLHGRNPRGTVRDVLWFLGESGPFAIVYVALEP